MSLRAFCWTILLPLLGLSVMAAFLRLVRGPSVPDRVIALDFMATLGIGITAVHAVAEDQPVYLDVAVVLGLLSFLGTVAFAYYIERKV